MARRRNNRRRIVRQENAANRVSNAMVRRIRPPRISTAGGVTVVTGSELLTNVNTMGGSTQQLINIDPGGLTNTWLGRQATLFNKYRYVRATLRYSPFVPTSTPGRIIMSWCGDPTQTPSTSSFVASQFANAVEAPLWRDVSCNMAVGRTPEYTISTTYTGSEAGGETESPGQFIVYTDYGTGTSNVPCGSVYLDYEIHLWERSSFTGN